MVEAKETELSSYISDLKQLITVAKSNRGRQLLSQALTNACKEQDLLNK